MDIWDQITAAIVDYGPKLGLALVVLWVGLFLIKKVAALFDYRAQKRNMDPSLRPFLRQVMTTALKVMLIISVASMVGIAMTSFVAVLGAAGLAVGLALQGSLANFAGGVLILAFRPFKVGDVVEAMGYTGKVHEIQVFSTILKTLDNKTIIIPNGSLSNSSVVNFSTEANRRVDVRVTVGRGEDMDKVKAAILKVAAADGRILGDPAPYCRVGELAGATATYDVRAWCAGTEYPNVLVDLVENIKKELDSQGIQVPAPFMQVQIKNGAELGLGPKAISQPRASS